MRSRTLVCFFLLVFFLLDAFIVRVFYPSEYRRSILNRSIGASDNHLVLAMGEQKSGRMRFLEYWEIIADNLKKAGSSVGWVSTPPPISRTDECCYT